MFVLDVILISRLQKQNFSCVHIDKLYVIVNGCVCRIVMTGFCITAVYRYAQVELEAVICIAVTTECRLALHQCLVYMFCSSDLKYKQTHKRKFI